MACATLRDGKRWTRRVAAGNRRRKTENQSCWTSAWRINTWQLQGVWARVSQACNKSSRQSIFPRSLMATHDPTVSMRPNHADIPNHLFIDSSFTYSAANMFLSPLLPGVRMLLRALTWLLVLPASQAQVSSQYLINSPFMFFIISRSLYPLEFYEKNKMRAKISFLYLQYTRRYYLPTFLEYFVPFLNITKYFPSSHTKPQCTILDWSMKKTLNDRN